MSEHRAGMSEYQRLLNESKNPANWQDTPDPTTAALDALRAAVVAQTALLRSLSEQVRLGFESVALRQDQDREAISGWIAMAQNVSEKGVAGLAERLDGIERKLGLIPGIVAIVSEGKDLLTNRLDRQANQIGSLTEAFQAIEAKLPAQDTQSLATSLPTHREIRNALARKKITRKDLRRRGKAKR